MSFFADFEFFLRITQKCAFWTQCLRTAYAKRHVLLLDVRQNAGRMQPEHTLDTIGLQNLQIYAIL